jgi:hypothetical protein
MRAINVYEPCSWEIRGDPSLTDLYTKVDFENPQWSIPGIFQLILTGDPSVTACGTLWLEYEIEFISDSLALDGICGARSVDAITGCTPTIPFGTAPTDGVFNSLPIPLPTDGTTLYLPTGIYWLNYHVVGTGITAIPTAKSNCTELQASVCINGAGTLVIVDQVLECEPNASVALTVTGTTVTETFVTAIRCPDEYSVTSKSAFALLTKITPGLTPLQRGFQLKEMLGESPWKMPAQLAQRGADWLAEHGKYELVKKGSKLFSRVVGWVLNSGLLGALRLTEPLDPDLLAFWAKCGFKNIGKPLPRPSTSSEDEKAWTMVSGRK